MKEKAREENEDGKEEKGNWWQLAVLCGGCRDEMKSFGGGTVNLGKQRKEKW